MNVRHQLLLGNEETNKIAFLHVHLQVLTLHHVKTLFGNITHLSSWSSCWFELFVDFQGIIVNPKWEQPYWFGPGKFQWTEISLYGLSAFAGSRFSGVGLNAMINQLCNNFRIFIGAWCDICQTLRMLPRTKTSEGIHGRIRYTQYIF